MYEITSVVRRTGLPGTHTKLVPYLGEWLFSLTEAQVIVSELTRLHRDTIPHPLFGLRKVYLPACAVHHELEADCVACADHVAAWLEELHEETTDRIDPEAPRGS